MPTSSYGAAYPLAAAFPPFNQLALLAHEVARLAHVRVEPLALLRVRRTKAQVGLSRERRRQNVSGASFAVAPSRKAAIAGAKIVFSSTTSSPRGPRSRPALAP
jgi:predicted amidophosphoribosyltransferase